MEFITHDVQSSGSGDSDLTGEVCIKCFGIPADPQESLISGFANWLDTSSRLLSKSLLGLWLDIRDSTLNGWLDTWVLRCSMSRSPSDSFKLADADILLATSLWTPELQKHSDVSCKKTWSLWCLEARGHNRTFNQSERCQIEARASLPQQHTATVKLLANENAAESGSPLHFSRLAYWVCKDLSVIMIDKMTATDFRERFCKFGE